MIFVSFYSNHKFLNNLDKFTYFKISVGFPKNFNENLRIPREQLIEYPKLFLSKQLVLDYKANKISQEEYTKIYIENVLNKLNVHDTYNELISLSIPKNPVLLCYEKTGFCHRNLVMKWFLNNRYICQKF